MSSTQAAFWRHLGVIVLFAILSFLCDAANFNGILSAGTAAIVAGLAGTLDSYLEKTSGTALMGAVTVKR
jgi:hypothetical protein